VAVVSLASFAALLMATRARLSRKIGRTDPTSAGASQMLASRTCLVGGLTIVLDSAVHCWTVADSMVAFPLACRTLRSIVESTPDLCVTAEDLGLSGPILPDEYHRRCVVNVQQQQNDPQTGKETVVIEQVIAAASGPFSNISDVKIIDQHGVPILYCRFASAVMGSVGYSVVQICAKLSRESDESWQRTLTTACISPTPLCEDGFFVVPYGIDAEFFPVQCFDWTSAGPIPRQSTSQSFIAPSPFLPTLGPCFVSRDVVLPLTAATRCRATCPVEPFIDVFVAFLLTLRHEVGECEVSCHFERLHHCCRSATGRRFRLAPSLDAVWEPAAGVSEEIAAAAVRALCDSAKIRTT
jgi:hypothetical protein